MPVFRNGNWTQIFGSPRSAAFFFGLMVSAIVAVAMVCSIRPAVAYVIFSDMVVFTTPDVNLTGMTAQQFAAAQAGFGAKILHTFAIVERDVIGPPAFSIAIDDLLTEDLGLPPGIPLPNLHNPFDLLPAVPVGTSSGRVAMAEDGAVLSDVLTIDVPLDHFATYKFWSDKEGAPAVPKVPVELTLLETPNQFQSVVPQLFPPPLVSPYNVFIMSDCGSPADVCMAAAANVISEPSTWLLLATGLVGLLGCGLRQRASESGQKMRRAR
jgi:hypothetical protein